MRHAHVGNHEVEAFGPQEFCCAPAPRLRDDGRSSRVFDSPGALRQLVGIVVNQQDALARQKGFDRFIEAAGRIIGRRRDVQFVLAGDGPLNKKLRRRVKTDGLDDRFLFTGNLDDPGLVYRSADIVVVPSRWESCSYVILEAAALGRPIIAFESAGGTGMVSAVPEGNVEALAGAIIELVDDPQTRKQLGRQARDHVRRHNSVEQMIGKTERLYTEGIE